MATIKSIELSGWKSIKHAKVELGPINVLIGANGSGKSNFISFFKLLNSIIESQLQSFIMTAGGANSVLYYGAKTTSAMDFRLIVSAESELLEYKVRLADSPPDTVVFETERVMRGTVAEVSGPIDHSDLHAMFVGQHRESLLGNWTVNPPVNVGWMTNPVVREMVGLLRSCRPYHINDTSSTALIRRYGYIEDNRVLRSDAANLAAVLHRIRILTPKIYERIVRIIRQINPRFGDFVLEPQTLNPNQILLYWREKGQETLFGPHQLSDGTLRAMALVTLLLQPEAELPALLVVDEPELGLHPYALNVIVSLLQKASYHCQVIISTQSVQLLDYFDTHDVIVVDRRGEASEFTRLSEENLSGWLEDYSLGELWEKNVLGGGPH